VVSDAVSKRGVYENAGGGGLGFLRDAAVAFVTSTDVVDDNHLTWCRVSMHCCCCSEDE
jgi:hypothetical protein